MRKFACPKYKSEHIFHIVDWVSKPKVSPFVFIWVSVLADINSCPLQLVVCGTTTIWLQSQYEDKRCKCVCPCISAVLNNTGATGCPPFIDNVPPNKWYVQTYHIILSSFSWVLGVELGCNLKSSWEFCKLHNWPFAISTYLSWKLLVILVLLRIPSFWILSCGDYMILWACV